MRKILALCFALALTSCSNAAVVQAEEEFVAEWLVAEWTGETVSRANNADSAATDTVYLQLYDRIGSFLHGRYYPYTSPPWDTLGFIVNGNVSQDGNLLLEYENDADGHPCHISGRDIAEGDWRWRGSHSCRGSANNEVWFVRVAGEQRWRGLRVQAEESRTGYERPTWNVADTTIWNDDGQPSHTAYTCTAITNVGTGDGLDREHIVALAEAWDSRPDGMEAAELRAVAEDADNLTLAVAKANRSKSDEDAASWEPRDNKRWFAERVIEVKQRYDLSVDEAERDALELMLSDGTDAIVCG